MLALATHTAPWEWRDKADEKDWGTMLWLLNHQGDNGIDIDAYDTDTD